MAAAKPLLALIPVLALLAGCASDRVVHHTGVFGSHYDTIVTRPTVYDNSFCQSEVRDRDGPGHVVFVRASEDQCRRLAQRFDAHLASDDPFPGRSDAIHCAWPGEPHACERATNWEHELAGEFSAAGVDALHGDANQQPALDRFFRDEGELWATVLMGFDAQPLSLECARFIRRIDEGAETVRAVFCRDSTRSWVVDLSWEEQ